MKIIGMPDMDYLENFSKLINKNYLYKTFQITLYIYLNNFYL